MSRSVCTLASTRFPVPQGTVETENPPLHSIRQAVRRVCAPLRDFTLVALHCFLVNTVVFLPPALRWRTHRNAIQLFKVLEIHSFCSREKWKSRLRARAFHPPFENRGLSSPFFCKTGIAEHPYQFITDTRYPTRVPRETGRKRRKHLLHRFLDEAKAFLYPVTYFRAVTCCRRKQLQGLRLQITTLTNFTEEQLFLPIDT